MYIVHPLLPCSAWDEVDPTNSISVPRCASVEREQAIQVEKRVRSALAQELHDGPIQLISALLMQLDFCRQALEKEPTLVPEQIAHMQQLGERAVRQMRTMLFELRPVTLETQGLCAALRVFLEHRQQMAQATQLVLHIETCPPDAGVSRQEARIEFALFAVVREAVANALKHARAAHIEVCLKETPSAIHIVVVDDGTGFDVDDTMRHYDRRSSLGLLNMQEQAAWIGGKLEVKSAPGQGTRITVCVPKGTTSEFRSFLIKEENQ